MFSDFSRFAILTEREPVSFTADELSRNRNFNDRLNTDGTLERDSDDPEVARRTWDQDLFRKGLSSSLDHADNTEIKLCYGQRFANLAMVLQAITLDIAALRDYFVSDREADRSTHIYRSRGTVYMTCKATFAMRGMLERQENAKPVFSSTIEYRYDPKKHDFVLDRLEIKPIDVKFTKALCDRITVGIAPKTSADSCCSWFSASKKSSPATTKSTRDLDLSLPLIDPEEISASP